MSRFNLYIAIALFFVGCQLSPFKNDDSPSMPAPSAETATMPAVRQVQIPKPKLDFTIESQIGEILDLNEAQFGNIQVSSKKGIVTLTGNAPEGSWTVLTSRPPPQVLPRAPSPRMRKQVTSRGGLFKSEE
jgi:hypothetical protein